MRRLAPQEDRHQRSKKDLSRYRGTGLEPRKRSPPRVSSNLRGHDRSLKEYTAKRNSSIQRFGLKFGCPRTCGDQLAAPFPARCPCLTAPAVSGERPWSSPGWTPHVPVLRDCNRVAPPPVLLPGRRAQWPRNTDLRTSAGRRINKQAADSVMATGPREYLEDAVKGVREFTQILVRRASIILPGVEVKGPPRKLEK